MLDTTTFKKGLKVLSLYYTNFKFDFNDNERLEVWYDKVKNLDNDFYIKLINVYCDTNKYAPQSPFDLLETIKQGYIDKEMNEDEAWDYVLDLIRHYSFFYDRDKIYDELENKPLLKSLVYEFEPKLKDLAVGDIFTKREFKNAYKSNLVAYTTKKTQMLVGKNNENNLIGQKDTNLLENKQ